jgi:Cu/Ag efflux pump CusA
VQPGTLNEQVSTLLGGKTVAELREGQRTVDLVLRLPESWRDSPEKIGELLIETDRGQRIPLRLVADIREGKGPNVINRENTQRRIVIAANTGVRDLESLVNQWENAVREAKVKLPEGYFLRFRGRIPGAAGGGEAHRILLRPRADRHHDRPALRLLPQPVAGACRSC